MFLNFSNHPSDSWSTEQRRMAEEYGEIKDFDFPEIDPMLSKEEIEELAVQYSSEIISANPACVMCQGEFCMAYQVISILKKQGIRVVAACSARNTVEEYKDGKSIKKSEFKFIQFREY